MAQEKPPSPSPPESQLSVAARIDTGRDVFFAENSYTFTGLLRLRPDGTFIRYTRHHMFVAIVDDGQWRQADDGTLRLCSHHHSAPNRDGAITSHRVMRFDNITWVSEFDSRPIHEVEKDLLAEYRLHKKGPFLPGSATVEVDAKTFHELLGTRQGFTYRTEMNQVIPRDAELSDMRRKRLAAPECSGF